MNLDLSLAQSFPSLLAPTGVFTGFADQVSGQHPAASSATPAKAGIPTIPPPKTVYDSGFRSSLAPPMAPDTPGISPPEHGSGASKSMRETDGLVDSPTAKLAAFKQDMSSSQSNGTTKDRAAILQMLGAKV